MKSFENKMAEVLGELQFQLLATGHNFEVAKERIEALKVELADQTDALAGATALLSQKDAEIALLEVEASNAEVTVAPTISEIAAEKFNEGWDDNKPDTGAEPTLAEIAEEQHLDRITAAGDNAAALAEDQSEDADDRHRYRYDPVTGLER